MHLKEQIHPLIYLTYDSIKFDYKNVLLDLKE